MKIVTRSLWLLALLLLLTPSSIITAQKRAPAKPPNIVFIMSDDHAEQAISAYGSKLIKTPKDEDQFADKLPQDDVDRIGPPPSGNK